MDEKFIKLVEFSEKTFKTDVEIEPLHKLLEEIEQHEITEIVRKVIERRDAYQIFGCIFLGLTQKPLCQKKRLKIIETVIINLRTVNELKEKNTNILNKIIPELDKMKTNDLVRLCDVCIEVIRNPELSLKTSWMDVLPKTLNLINYKKVISYAGSEMSGQEFRSEIIKAICRMNVSSDIVIPLAIMFKEITMTSNEHKQIVQKMCELFDNIDTKNLPELVQELLQLCKDEHIVILFLKLRYYFSKYLHSYQNNDADKIDDERKKEVLEAESIILNHIEEFARISRINDLMKLCKNASNASSLLLDPFLLSVLLILSCIPAYETQITDLLRLMITQAIAEEERKKESAWLCHIIQSKFDVDELFSETIQSRLCEHDKVVVGLMNLGFTLLSVAGIKNKELMLKKIWRIGRIILVSLIKKHRKITKSVLQNLTDRIITGCVSQQYTDCLLHLCNVASITMVDNFPMVVRILEFINSMPGIVSQRIVVSVIPLVQISTNLRDSLIMYLRKALFSRNIEIRQTAVLGFLQLLKFLKLQKISTFSQNTLTQTTFQGPSVFTQICMDVHTQQTMSQQVRPTMNPYINEAICLEVMGILKRCFMQQVSVKTTLYKGLFAAICVNSQLCAIVLDVLLDHFSQFYENDIDILPPIIFQKTIFVRNSQVSLQEPIGQLILLIQDVLQRTRTIAANMDDDENETTRTVQKFNIIFESLIVRFSKCDLNHFQLDDSINMLDTSCESMKNQEIIRQILSVYEALMAYTVNSWSRETPPEIANKLIELHKAYSIVAEFAMNFDKSTKKKDKDTSKDSTKDSDITTGEKKKRSSKKDRSSLPKKCPFKLPPTILSLKTVNRLLSLFLLDEIEWASNTAVQEIKPRLRLFNYSMISALDAVRQMKIRLNEEQRSSAVFNDVVSLAKLIFLRCLSRYNEIAEYETGAAVTSVECFTEIISLMLTHYNSKFPQFLEQSVFVSAEEGLPKQLLPVLKVYKNLLNTLLVSANEDVNNTNEDDDSNENNRILTPAVINAIKAVVLALPTDHDVTNKIVDWLVSIAEKYYFVNSNNSKAFMNLLFSMHSRCRVEMTLLDSLCSQLCHIFPSITEATPETAVRPLMMVSDSSKIPILTMTCTTLISHLDDAEYMITRFKSENIILSYLQDDSDNPRTQYSILKRRERELCEYIMHITLMTETLISIAAPTGTALESLIKFLTRTFSVLTAFTKYFTLRSTCAEPIYQNAFFHKLVKIAGSQFIRQKVSELILYVEKDYENENKKSLSHLNNQAKKQFVQLPKLVSEMESFPKAVLQLSKKCKDASLLNRMKLTITRDFRLNIRKVDELISKQKESDSDEENEINEEPLLSSTRIDAEPSQKRKRTS
ncbi:hypothetical protein PGB90_004507 [Kerria lacca]